MLSPVTEDGDAVYDTNREVHNIWNTHSISLLALSSASMDLYRHFPPIPYPPPLIFPQAIHWQLKLPVPLLHPLSMDKYFNDNIRTKYITYTNSNTNN